MWILGVKELMLSLEKSPKKMLSSVLSDGIRLMSSS